jgi:hypothetical protein
MYKIPQDSHGFIFSLYNNSTYIFDQNGSKIQCFFPPDQYRTGISRGAFVGYTIHCQQNNFYCTNLHTIEFPPTQPYTLYSFYMLLLETSNAYIQMGLKNKNLFEAILLLYEQKTQQKLTHTNSVQKKIILCYILFLLDAPATSFETKKCFDMSAFYQPFSTIINEIEHISKSFSAQFLASIDLWLLECLSMHTQIIHKKDPHWFNDFLK